MTHISLDCDWSVRARREKMEFPWYSTTYVSVYVWSGPSESNVATSTIISYKTMIGSEANVFTLSLRTLKHLWKEQRTRPIEPSIENWHLERKLSFFFKCLDRKHGNFQIGVKYLSKNCLELRSDIPNSLTVAEQKLSVKIVTWSIYFFSFFSWNLKLA